MSEKVSFGQPGRLTQTRKAFHLSDTRQVNFLGATGAQPTLTLIYLVRVRTTQSYSVLHLKLIS